jgi:hypothetical protein
MTREELEHLIRAAAEVTDEYEFVIVGSQSILGPIPNPPAELTMSMEAGEPANEGLTRDGRHVAACRDFPDEMAFVTDGDARRRVKGCSDALPVLSSRRPRSC